MQLNGFYLGNGWGWYRHGFRRIRCNVDRNVLESLGNHFQSTSAEASERSVASQWGWMGLSEGRSPGPCNFRGSTANLIWSLIWLKTARVPLSTLSQAVLCPSWKFFHIVDIPWQLQSTVIELFSSVWIRHFIFVSWAALSCYLWPFKICRIFFFFFYYDRD